MEKITGLQSLRSNISQSLWRRIDANKQLLLITPAHVGF